MRIVFHGANAASFAEGFGALLDPGAEVALLSDALDAPGERDAYAAIFAAGGSVRDLNAKEVNNLEAAILNAQDFAAEVIDKLRRQRGTAKEVA